jgi:hypothetical protein
MQAESYDRRRRVSRDVAAPFSAGDLDHRAPLPVIGLDRRT